MGLFRRRSAKEASDRRQANVAPPATPPQLSALGAPMWSGRDLFLPYPPTPEFASKLAQEFADSIAGPDASGPDLPPCDFSVGSLRTVDFLLGELEQFGSDDPAEVVMLAGFYAGEVLVRGYGYEWIDVPADLAPHFGFRVAVRGPSGSIANVLGKAFKRVENGDEDSIAFFVEAEIAGDSHTGKSGETT